MSPEEHKAHTQRTKELAAQGLVESAPVDDFMAEEMAELDRRIAARQAQARAPYAKGGEPAPPAGE